MPAGMASHFRPPFQQPQPRSNRNTWLIPATRDDTAHRVSHLLHHTDRSEGATSSNTVQATGNRPRNFSIIQVQTPLKAPYTPPRPTASPTARPTLVPPPPPPGLAAPGAVGSGDGGVGGKLTPMPYRRTSSCEIVADRAFMQNQKWRKMQGRLSGCFCGCIQGRGAQAAVGYSLLSPLYSAPWILTREPSTI